MSELRTSDIHGSRDPEKVSLFVERLAQTFVEAGLPRIASRIFIALTATDSGRLTAADLAEQLQASAGAISGGVRYLVQVGLISREREPGSRRDHYRVADDVWSQTFTQRDQILGRWAEGMREGAAVLGPDTPAGRRFVESVELLEFLQKELAVALRRWEEQRSRHRGQGDR